MADQQAQLVKEALATGIFVERTEPTKGRKYYVNRRTKESVWQLTRAIVDKAKAAAAGGGAAGGGGAAAAQAAAIEEKRAVVRDERMEQTRRRAEIEAQLRASVSALERQKYELESELAGVEGPVEGEIEELEVLRRELADSRSSLITVERDVLQQRKRRHGELQDILTKVAAMQSLAESEKRHREAVEERHSSLTEEGLGLKADIGKERAALEGLRESLEASERRIIEAEGKLQRQRDLISLKEEEIGRAEAELRELCAAKARVDDDVGKMRAEIEAMAQRAAARGDSFAQQNKKAAAAVDNETNASQKLLFHLVTECETKKRTLAQLKRSGDKRDETARGAEQNARLARLIDGFTSDKGRLEALDRFLRHQLSQANGWLLDAKAECLALTEEVAVMEAADAREAEEVAQRRLRQQQRAQRGTGGGGSPARSFVTSPHRSGGLF